MSDPTTDNIIHFGDVIKLHTKSALQEGAGGFLGFMKDKAGRQQLLVVPPVDGAAFVEAEFIVAPTRDYKPQSLHEPLNYKQPFVLKTSDGNGYSINNKTPSLNDVISLQPTGVKGEMYMSIEKEGYTSDTNVHDGDMNLTINVVDSNRIRKNYNKPLTHFAKAKTAAAGGFVCSGAKGQPLSFKITKVMGATKTAMYIENPVYRRSSMEPEEPVKSDEVNDAEVVEKDEEEGAESKTNSLASIDAKSPSEGNQDEIKSGDAQNNEAAPESPTSDASTTGTAESTTPTPASDDPLSTDNSVKTTEVVVETKTPVEAELEAEMSAPSTLTTIPIDPEPASTSAPVVDKLTVIPQQISAATVTSEGDGETVEQVEMGCIGKCSIM